MKPALFDYADPTSLDEVLTLLAERGDEAKILAGGQSLVPLLNMRLAAPDLLIDINRLPGQDGITSNGEGLAIGPLVRQSDVEREPLDDRYAILKEAIEWVGHPQIRNRGTVLGSLAHADPAAELPLVFLVLDGQMQIASVTERRTVVAEDFFVHIMTTCMEPDEMLVGASLQPLAAGAGGSFLEVSRRHGDFATVAAAATVTLEGGVCTEARIALGGVAPMPIRARQAEETLIGARMEPRALTEAAIAAANETRPGTDIHATAEYRREVAGVLVRRTLTRATAVACSSEATKA